jgi:hypothetical protein
LRMLSEEAKEIRFAGRTQVSGILYDCFSKLTTNLVPMNKKSSTNAPTAAIASKTRTKLKDIKILCISAVIHGLVLLCRDMLRHSIHPYHVQTKQTLVDTVEKTSQDPALHLLLRTDRKLLLRRIRTGTSGLAICKRCINLVSVTMRRSFSAPIISVNISSIATPARVANGRTCLKMHA